MSFLRKESGNYPAGALCVDSTKGNCGWWSISADDVTTRSCFFDDRVVFSTNGEMSNNHGDETWVEEWQNFTSEGCRPYVTKDTWASNTATWSWNSSTNELTVNWILGSSQSPQLWRGF